MIASDTGNMHEAPARVNVSFLRVITNTISSIQSPLLRRSPPPPSPLLRNITVRMSDVRISESSIALGDYKHGLLLLTLVCNGYTRNPFRRGCGFSDHSSAVILRYP